MTLKFFHFLTLFLLLFVQLLFLPDLIAKINLSDPMKFEMNYQERKNFIDKVIIPSLEGSDYLLPSNFILKVTPIGMGLVPAVAAVPYLTTILGPLGFLQRGFGDILRGANKTTKIIKRNDAIRTVSLSKLNLLKPFLNEQEIIWFWRYLRGEGIICHHNRIKKEVSPSLIREAFSIYIEKIKKQKLNHHIQPYLDNFIGSFSYVELTHKDDLLFKTLTKIKILDKSSRLTDKKISSLKIIKELKNKGFSNSIIYQTLHNLGFVHPDDLVFLKREFPLYQGTFFNILLEKRYNTLAEIEEAFDTIWLTQKGHFLKLQLVTGSKLLKEKLKYAEQREETDPSYNLIKLEKEMMDFKKKAVYQLHLRKINNDVLIYKGVKAGEVITAGQNYCAGIGFMSRGFLRLLINFASLSGSALTGVTFASNGALVLAGSVVASIGLLNLTRDIPSYAHLAQDIKIANKVLDHLKKAKKNHNLTQEEEKILQFKGFEIKAALELQKQQRKMLTNRLALDTTLLGIGVTATSIGVLGIITTASASFASAYGAPIGIALSSLLISFSIPLTILTIDYIHRQHKNKKTAELLQYLQKGVKESLAKEDIFYTHDVEKVRTLFSQNKDIMFKLGFAQMGLNRDRERLAQKKHGPIYETIFQKRYRILTHDITKHKKKIKEKLIKSLEEEIDFKNPDEILALTNTPLRIHRDAYDHFDILTVLEEKKGSLPENVPSWMLSKANQKPIAKAFAHFILAFIDLKEVDFERGFYLKDQNFIRGNDISIRREEIDSYKNKVEKLSHDNKESIKHHLKKWEEIMRNKVLGLDLLNFSAIKSDFLKLMIQVYKNPHQNRLEDFPNLRHYLLLFIPAENL